MWYVQELELLEPIMWFHFLCRRVIIVDSTTFIIVVLYYIKFFCIVTLIEFARKKGSIDMKLKILYFVINKLWEELKCE